MRRQSLIPACIWVLWCLTLLTPGRAKAQDSTATPLATILAEIDTALSYIKLTSADLALRTDYVDLDSFRLAIVDRVMLQPTDMAVVLDSVAQVVFDGLMEHESGGKACLDVCSGAMGSPPGMWRGRFTPPEPELNAIETIRLLLGDEAPDSLLTFVGKNRPGTELTDDAIGAYLALNDPRSGLAGQLTDDEWRFVRDTLPQMLWEDPEAENYSPEKMDSLQRAAEEISARFVTISDRLDWRGWQSLLVKFCQGQLTALSDELYMLTNWESTGRTPDYPAEKHIFTTPVGRVAFGSSGDDTYSGKYFFIFDPAGNDVYNLDPVEPGECQFIYDLAGNDMYTAPEGYSLGCGLFAIGLLYDREGDDTYRAANFALGSGFFGGGMLIDEAGDDVYISDTFSQGAGAFGFGFLYDHAGSDEYRAALYSQAFGFAAGVGLLADREGNDNYFAGGKYKDILRYDDHYLSLSQGFSYGIRPDFSGGVGLLMDGAGNDVYTADIFAQGCSYWWAFGALYDGGGNDSYNCFQYGQGAATHMAAGILFDKAGGDVYFGKGLMQGCGHDRSTGWMLDLDGDDTYVAWDLSQGGGSANGTGMLTDLAGDDRYYVKNLKNTQGYGNPRRDFGSIGLFLDLGGRDRYDGNGRDDDVWIIDSKWGVGVDKYSQPDSALTK